MATSNDTNFDILTSWLIKIAENTARTRDAVEARGGAAGSKSGSDDESSKSRSERALEALGKRFESSLSRWSNTPVEKLINTSMDATMSKLNSSVSSALSTARGLANRGFSGTVEQARYDFAMEQLGKQFAAVMMPVMQGMTYFAEQVEKRFRGMSGSEQNRLMGMGLGAYAGLRLGGPLGALAGAALGGSLMGGDSAAGTTFGAAGGAYLGARVAGVPGAIAGATIAAVTSAPAHRPDERPFDYYNRMRAGKASVFDAVLATGGRSLSVTFGDAARALGMDTDVGRPAAPRRPEPPRAVTPYNPNMVEAGGTYFEMQKGVTRATAGDGVSEDGGPLKPIFDALLQVIGLLAQLVGLAGGTPALVPTSASGSS
jgi:hypothetical protein